MDRVTLIFVLFFSINITVWFVRMRISHKYIKGQKFVKKSHGLKFVVVIPVLNEEKRIEKAIEMCSNIVDENIEIVFATTAKEMKLKGILNTIELIEMYEEKYSWIKSYQYDGNGYMAHQLNYAIQSYCLENNVDQNVIFAVYNIDSVIKKDVLEWVGFQYSNSSEKQVIYQQYGYYCKNWTDCNGISWIEKAILKSNMLWQTRWSTGFEMAHALIGIRLCKKNIWFMNYCIGHGLFFNIDVYRKLGGFEEETLNEDAIWGLQACIKNIRIIPIPWLELADSPDMVKSLFKQKITWIYGPGQAFEYRKLISKRNEIKEESYLRLWLLCVQLFEHATRWVMVPLIVVAALLWSFFQSILNGILMSGVIVFYLAGVNLINLGLCIPKSSITVSEIFCVAVGCIPQFVMHGISGWIGLIQLMRKQIFGKIITKKKTEMK